MDKHRFLAFDLGAESGRAVVGTLTEGKLSLEEIHRFPNEPVELLGTLYWDALSLHKEILKGMKIYSGRFGGSVDGIGIDSWVVDFGLLARDGTLLGNPVHYRDPRTEGMVEKISERMSPEKMFELTGMPASPILTLCQLYSLRLRQSTVLESASTLLMMPNLFAYFLTGDKRCERTAVITTQLYDPRGGLWHKEIFTTFGLPISIMPDLVDPGTVQGDLNESVKRETGLTEAPVVAPCTHDTASAVAAVPGKGDDWAFLSSGTWSVLGSLTEEVVTSPEAFRAGMANELTLKSFFLCRNIVGLWLLQQARATWQRSVKEYSYTDIVRLSEEAPEGGPLIYPDDESFLAPADMIAAIGNYCKGTGQKPPHGPAETARCIIESLALCYRHSLEKLSEILGRRFGVLHIVGGGTLNTLLCRFTADATGLPVLAGPVEATVAGNVLVQALSRGFLTSPQEIRDIVRRSFDLVEYEPRDTTKWEDRYGQYMRLVERGE
jgi:rhamnulokinase